jgi:hypothetical protein
MTLSKGFKGMLREEWQKIIVDWSSFFSTSTWIRKTKKVLFRLSYFFLKMLYPRPLFILSSSLIASYFIIIEVQKVKFGDYFLNIFPDDMEVSLEIATSVSVLLAMIIFIVTTVLENRRHSKARRQEFKIKKNNRFVEYLIEKKPKIFSLYEAGLQNSKDIFQPYLEYKGLLNIAEDAEERFLEEFTFSGKDLSKDQLNELNNYKKEQRFLYDDFLKENGESLVTFYSEICLHGFSTYGVFFSAMLHFDKLRQTLSEIEDFISIDPMMRWSLGENVTEQLLSQLQQLREELCVKPFVIEERDPELGDWRDGDWGARVKSDEEEKKVSNFRFQIDACETLEDKIDFVYEQFLRQHNAVVSKRGVLESKLRSIENIVSYSLTEALVA